jgi:predicted Zn-dependent peptidase
MDEKDNFSRIKLKNGMTVLFEKRNINLVNVLISFKYGSAYENEIQKGVAHILEHSLFKGTKNRTQKEISEQIEKRGGIINAFTSEDVTAFYSKISSKHFNLSSDILTDLAFNPLLNENELKKEKEVILQELKMWHDNPYLHVLNLAKNLLYDKPFGMNQIGSEKTIKNMTSEEVERIHAKNYSPFNSIFCVVGNSSEEEIKNALNQIKFNKNFLKPAIIPKIKKRNGVYFEKRKGIDQAHVILGSHISYKDRYVFEIVNAILTEGMSSILWQEIREKRGLVYAIKGILDIGRNYGHYLIYAGTEKKNIKEVRRIILNEFSRLKNLNNKELEDAKEKLIGLRNLSKEDSSNVSLSLLQEEIFGNSAEFYNYEQRINDVKLADLKGAFKSKKYSLAAIIPK